jgi:hypothetical protein
MWREFQRGRDRIPRRRRSAPLATSGFRTKNAAQPEGMGGAGMFSAAAGNQAFSVSVDEKNIA